MSYKAFSYSNFKDLIIDLIKSNYDFTQAKDVFTTMCILYDINSDTYECDCLLREIYDCSLRYCNAQKIDYISFDINNYDCGNDSFYNFMVQDII